MIVNAALSTLSTVTWIAAFLVDAGQIVWTVLADRALGTVAGS